MKGTEPKEKPKRGRPVKRTMPEPIPDTLDNVMRALVNAPPKKKEEWAYLRESGKDQP